MNLKRQFETHARLIKNRSYFVGVGVSVMLLLVLIFNYAFITMTKNCFSTAMVFIVEDGALTKSQTGAITGTFFVVYGFLQIVGGVLADKWHPERLLTIGFVCAGIANLVIYLNQSYLVMFAAWIFNALTQFPVWPATFKIASSMLSPKIRSKAIFFMSFSSALGFVLGYLVAAIVPRWQTNFLVSALGLFGCAILWSIVWTIARFKSEVKENEHEAPIVPHHDDHRDVSFVKLLFSSGMAFMVVVSFISSAFNLGVKTFTPTIIKESYDNVSASFATIISIVVVIAGACGSFFTKLWYPRFVKNEALGYFLMMFVGIFPCAALLLVGKVNYWIIVISMSLLMFFLSSGGLCSSYMQASFNRWGKSGTLSGITNFSASFGVFFANFFFTRIADGYGWLATLKVSLALVILGAVLALASIPLWKKYMPDKK